MAVFTMGYKLSIFPDVNNAQTLGFEWTDLPSLPHVYNSLVRHGVKTRHLSFSGTFQTDMDSRRQKWLAAFTCLLCQLNSQSSKQECFKDTPSHFNIVWRTNLVLNSGVPRGGTHFQRPGALVKEHTCHCET